MGERKERPLKVTNSPNGKWKAQIRERAQNGPLCIYQDKSLRGGNYSCNHEKRKGKMAHNAVNKPFSRGLV